MNSGYLNFAKLLAAIVVSTFLSIQSNAQIESHTQSLPFMWSPDSPAHITNFIRNKKIYFDSVSHINQPDSFYLGNFFGMIRYFEDRYKDTFQCLHVYIAAYSTVKPEKVPPGHAGMLTLIFAPATGYLDRDTNRDLNYYSIPPGKSFDGSHPKRFVIRRKIAQDWQENYINNLMPSIWNTIDSSDPQNRVNGQLSDTRRIIYCRASLDSLIKELTFIHKRKNDSTNRIVISKDLIARLAAYGEDGREEEDETTKNKTVHINKRRIYIYWDFADIFHRKFLLEDALHFANRLKIRKQASCDTCTPPEFAKLNNGQLCPPSANCPPGSK